jgi:hypothetical protein
MLLNEETHNDLSSSYDEDISELMQDKNLAIFPIFVYRHFDVLLNARESIFMNEHRSRI